jgi:hypothetical protein
MVGQGGGSELSLKCTEGHRGRKNFGSGRSRTVAGLGRFVSNQFVAKVGSPKSIRSQSRSNFVAKVGGQIKGLNTTPDFGYELNRQSVSF